MNVSKFIAGKLHFKGRTAFWATAFSAFVIVVAVCVSQGFRREIHGGIRHIAGDALILDMESSFPVGRRPFDAGQALEPLSAMGFELESAQGVIFENGALRVQGSFEGVLFKGVEGLDAPLQAVVNGGLARKCGLEVGDTITAYFLKDRLRARNFRVREIREEIETEQSAIIECPIEDLRRLERWGEGEVNAIELKFKDPERSRELCESAGILLYDTGLTVRGARAEFRILFDWLDMIEANVMAIIILMSIVAGFNMIASMLILLMGSTSAIGTLKTLGMDDKGIAKVFLRLGARFSGMGIALGAAMGTLLCLVQKFTHLLKLDPANYFISFVPIEINIPMILITGIIAWATIMLFLLAGSLYISRIDPSDSVRAD